MAALGTIFLVERVFLLKCRALSFWGILEDPVEENSLAHPKKPEEIRAQDLGLLMTEFQTVFA